MILILSVYVARSAGAWVLGIGAARYAFLVAGWPLAWMRAALPSRDWRKVVTATQGIVLDRRGDARPAALVNQAALVVALALLAESFGRDVWWLWRRRRAYPALAPAVVARHRRHGPRRPRLSPAPSQASPLLIVWTALVAPDQPQDLTLTAFLRVPLEGLVLVALAVVLAHQTATGPGRSRRARRSLCSSS